MYVSLMVDRFLVEFYAQLFFSPCMYDHMSFCFYMYIIFRSIIFSTNDLKFAPREYSVKPSKNSFSLISYFTFYFPLYKDFLFVIMTENISSRYISKSKGLNEIDIM